MTEARPHVEEIRKQFTRQAETYAQMEQTSDVRALARLVKWSGVTSTDRVLDVACGPGFLTAEFAAVVSEAVGFDATNAMLDVARASAVQRGLGNLHFQSGEAERLPFQDGEFNLAACRAAYHHFPEPDQALREMKRVVKPDGHVLVADMITSDDPRKADYQNRVERLCDPTHCTALGTSQFESMFQDVGLVVESSNQSEIEYDLDEWILHGGPEPEVADEIRRLMQASVENDVSGLCVRLENDRLRFRHQTIVYLLSHAGSSY